MKTKQSLTCTSIGYDKGYTFLLFKRVFCLLMFFIFVEHYIQNEIQGLNGKKLVSAFWFHIYILTTIFCSICLHEVMTPPYRSLEKG